MDSSDRNADDLFFAALEIEDAAARASFLAESCGADAGLRGRVERLLGANAHVGRFLEPPTAAATVACDGPYHRGGSEQVVGPYKLLEPIGEGGMGTVYMAEQTAPVRRTVALKVVKAGMDSRQVLARFDAERQALALMDHPNIAKVLDAGTTAEGRPYFVMELVKGVPITRFCDERRLAPCERLELFIAVCQAVQHAHQKGVIHRDLKPSNVLVALYDGRPVPKVIDFGVAKATGQKLTEATLFTGFGTVVGTPEYMSPEQAELNQLDIDTRSDVYSLGVLLYELLTGTTPIDRRRLKEAAILEVLRVVREVEPPRPSTRLSTTEELPSIAAARGVEPRKLAGLVRGELDWVVMKALEKDRNRRYETASGLAADLRRYLDDEPVAACPPSARYRLGKLARRHRGLLATAAVVLAALLTGTAVATWQAIRATRAEGRTAAALVEARDQRQEARQAVDEMYTQVAEKWLAGQSALTQLQREFLEKALAFYERFASTAGADPQARHDAVRALYRVGSIRLELGRHAEAEAALRQAVDRGADLARRHPDHPEFRLGVAESRLKLAATLRQTGRASSGVKGVGFTMGGTVLEFAATSQPVRTREADDAVRRAAEDLAALGKTLPRDAALRRRRAEAEGLLSRELTLTRQLPEAEAAARAALDIWASLAKHDPTEIEHRYGLAGAYRRLGTHLMWWGGQNAKAEEALRQAEARFSGLLKEHPGDRRFRQARADTLQNLAIVRSWETAPAEAEAMERQAVSLFEGLAVDFPDVPAYTEGEAACLNNLAGDLERQERLPEAEEAQRRSLDLRERLADRHPEVPKYEMEVAGSFQGLAVLLSKQGKHEEALDVAGRGLQRARAYWKAHPELKTAPANVTNLLVNQLRIVTEAGDRVAAARHAEEWARLALEKFTAEQLGTPVVELCTSQIEGMEDDTPAIISMNRMMAGSLIREADRRGLDDPEALRRLADLMTLGPEELRDPERALRFARRAFELKPGDGMCRQSLGWALYRAGDLTGCMEHLSEQDFMHCAFLAMAHCRLGDEARARACYDMAVKGLAGYEKRWKPTVYPPPTMLRLMRDEAAAMLGAADAKAATDSPGSHRPR